MSVAKIFALGLLALGTLNARAGVVIEFVDRNTDTGAEAPARTMSIQSGMARIETMGKRGSVVIFKNDALNVLDAETKSYLVFDKASIERAAATMNDMRAKIANLPPDQRAFIEQMMKQNGGSLESFGIPNVTQKPATYDAVSAGGGDTINGTKCKLWNVARDGAQVQQLCVASIGALPGGMEVVAVLKKISALMSKLGERALGRMGADMPSTAVQAKIKGYPLSSRAYRDGKLAPEQLVVKAWKQRVSIEPGQFTIPADYTRQELPEFGTRESK